MPGNPVRCAGLEGVVGISIVGDLLEGAVEGVGVVGKVLAKGAVEGAKIGYEVGKVTGNVAGETAKGVAAAGKAIVD